MFRNEAFDAREDDRKRREKIVRDRLLSLDFACLTELYKLERFMSIESFAAK
jgi:hypothetical protein